jgi:uncharacterized membrane protein YfcA
LTFFLLIFGAGLGAGVLGALLGLGGGVIVVPTLTLAVGLNFHYAIGASIVAAIAVSSGAAASYLKDRITNVRLGMFLEVATTTGAVTGAYLAGLLPGRVLSVVFGVVLAYAAWSLLRTPGEDVSTSVETSRLAARLRLPGAYDDPVLKRRVTYPITGVPGGFGMMWMAGLISGLLGIGAGAFKVLALDLMMRAPLKVSTTTANFMIGVTAAASAGVYFTRGDINPFVAAPVTLGVLLGTVAGTRLLRVLPARVIRRIFVVVLAVVALQMVWRGLAGTIR